MDRQGVTPHFEFGYGLSYTTFSYSALSIATSGTSRVITFTLKNTGTVAGTEVPQLYLSFPASADEPKMVLRGFDDIDLAAGASASVSMTISQREMRSGPASTLLFPANISPVFGMCRVNRGRNQRAPSPCQWAPQSRISG